MKKRGITLVSILIVVVVLTALTGIITVSTSSIIRDTYKEEFFREYKLVQAAMDDYIIRNSGIIDFTQTTMDLAAVESKYMNQFSAETISGTNTIDVYVIDLEKIGVKNPTYGIGLSSDDNYVVSKETNIVYYQKGFENDGYIYYIDLEN